MGGESYYVVNHTFVNHLGSIIVNRDLGLSDYQSIDYNFFEEMFEYMPYEEFEKIEFKGKNNEFVK